MNVQWVFNFAWNDLPAMLFAVFLGIVLFLVVRQNAKDFVDLEVALAEQTG